MGMLTSKLPFIVIVAP